MSRRTFTWNAFETELTQALLSGVTTAVVDSVVGLAAPLYLVVDPDEPLKREWIRVNTINGNNLENIVRGLSGSVGGAGGVDHDPGAKVRAMFSMQNLDDIFLDILDNTDAGGIHIGDPGDPHANAGYLKLAAANGLYVNKDGDVMTGLLTLSGAPTANLHAATKLYVDDLVGGIPIFSGLHSDLTDLPDPSAHHTRYTDNESQLAMGLINDINPFHHNRYTDGEAVSAVGPHFSGVHGDLSGIGAADHHAKYTDGEAVAAVAASGNYYTKAEIESIVASYYTLNTDAREIAGRRLYIQSADPGAIANGDVWHQTP